MAAHRVHLMGIGGVGMAGLAVLLRSRGDEVSGCDLRATSRTAWLERQGIPVRIGHDPAHVVNADEVIVTPAVDGDSPELLAARGRARVRYRGEVLAGLVSGRDAVAVCGSHGKTTTATWTARLLIALGEDVSWCIGGETGAFPVAGQVRDGSGGVLVVEADESDGTLALYHARTLVVNRCDYDHPDHFRTEADYLACYATARAQAGDVVESESLPPEAGGATADENAALAAILAPLPPHNRKNARAAVEVALRRGHSPAAVLAALPAVVAELPDRRFQRLADGVYADYAHHPAEMACAVGMARNVCRGTLRVLFQPHRYSRTKALLADFPPAFEGADEVVLCPTYAAFERPLEGGSVADLYRACRGRVRARLFLARSCEEAWTHAKRSARPGDVTLVLGAGDVISRLTELTPRRFWTGRGTNTWKSDLNLGEEYVRTLGPADAAGATLGIPWMAGVPGSIGGWIRMNAGAFGHSVSELVARVKVDGRWIDREACGFDYRTSALDGEIQDVEWRTDALERARRDGDAAAYLARRPKFPPGTWGSVFRNPPGDFAGRLLEAAGAKQLCVGGAYVWERHANVIVAPAGEATASDALALAGLMRDLVRHRFGVDLVPEVRGLDPAADGIK